MLGTWRRPLSPFAVEVKPKWSQVPCAGVTPSAIVGRNRRFEDLECPSPQGILVRRRLAMPLCIGTGRAISAAPKEVSAKVVDLTNCPGRQTAVDRNVDWYGGQCGLDKSQPTRVVQQVSLPRGDPCGYRVHQGLLVRTLERVERQRRTQVLAREGRQLARENLTDGLDVFVRASDGRDSALAQVSKQPRRTSKQAKDLADTGEVASMGQRKIMRSSA